MSWQTTWGGNSTNNNNAFTSGSAFFYQGGLGFPGGNPDLAGNARVYVEAIGAAYASGGTGVYATLIHEQGGQSGPGQWFPSGGSFQFRVGHSGGTQYVGRNTGAGGTMISSVDGRGFAGTMSGWMNYATYPSVPGSITVTREGRDLRVDFTGSGNDGGNALTRYVIQYTDGTGWKGDRSTGTGTNNRFTGLPPAKTYTFRVYAVNGYGAGAARQSGAIFLPASGKRYQDGGWTTTSIARRFNGTSWVDLTTGKRQTASGLVDLS